ncbi:MAG TPA: hypothetical protein EYP14_06050 [Planctomycetaceae bacterium]|nr:hypothetical protein [Planctomycetaceae bacterium]
MSFTRQVEPGACHGGCTGERMRIAPMAKFRVLSIDGGGIRGIVPAVILRRIVETDGFDRFLDSIDFVAGTSTGGLIALALADSMSAGELVDMYVSMGRKVFDDTWRDDLLDLGKLFGADYDIGPLRRELRRRFGSKRLGQLGKYVLVPTFDLDSGRGRHRTWKPKLFHNFRGAGSDRSALVAKVGLYACAAPTYFPSVDGYIDGDVYANNPAMCALAQTQDVRHEPRPPLEAVVLLSLGTGRNLQYLRGKTLDWGYAQWVRPLINLIFDGTAGIADYQCRQMLGQRYHRFYLSRGRLWRVLYPEILRHVDINKRRTRNGRIRMPKFTGGGRMTVSFLRET